MYIYRQSDRTQYKKLIEFFNFTAFEKFDYFFRRVHYDKNFLIECCNAVFKNIKRIELNNGEDILLVDGIYEISLSASGKGSYKLNIGNKNPGTFDLEGHPYPQFVSSIADNNIEGGGHIYTLLLSKYGILQNNPNELFRRLHIQYNFFDRYLLDYKTLYKQEDTFYTINDIFSENTYQNPQLSINISDYEKIINNNLITIPYPMEYGYKIEDIYWYIAENGGIHFGIIYFYNKDNELYKLPISMWSKFPIGNTYGNSYLLAKHVNNQLDLLHPAPPYHIFNKNKIVSMDKEGIVIICENEKKVREMEENTQNFEKFNVIFTCWSGGYDATIDDTDWEYLTGKQIAILITNNFNPKTVFHLYTRLNRANCLEIKFIDSESINSRSNFINIERNNLKFIDISEYVNNIYLRYNLVLDNKYIDRSLEIGNLFSLDFLPTPFVIKDLVKLGEQIMIFGPRGVSKSYFSYVLAISIASGINVFDDQLVVEQPLKVLIIDGEMEISLIQRRLQSIAYGLGINQIDNLSILSSSYENEIFDFSNEKQLAKYSKSIQDSDVIILDSVAFTFPGAMGSSTESSKDLNAFLLNNRNSNITTIVIDHASTKGNKKSPDSFGTSTKSFALDLILSLSKNNNIIDVDITKARSLTKSGTLLKYKFFSSVDRDDREIIKFDFINPNKKRTIPNYQLENNILQIIKLNPGILGTHILQQLDAKKISCKRGSLYNNLDNLLKQNKISKKEHKNGYFITMNDK